MYFPNKNIPCGILCQFIRSARSSSNVAYFLQNNFPHGGHEQGLWLHFSSWMDTIQNSVWCPVKKRFLCWYIHKYIYIYLYVKKNIYIYICINLYTYIMQMKNNKRHISVNALFSNYVHRFRWLILFSYHRYRKKW